MAGVASSEGGVNGVGAALPERSRHRCGVALTRRACRGVLAGGGVVELHSSALCLTVGSAASGVARGARGCSAVRPAARAGQRTWLCSRGSGVEAGKRRAARW